VNDYIMRLIARSLGLLEVVTPRLAALYEPLPSDIWDTLDAELREVQAQERSQKAPFELSKRALKGSRDPGGPISKEETRRDPDLAGSDLAPFDGPVPSISKGKGTLKGGVIKRPVRPSLGENAQNRGKSRSTERVLERKSADEKTFAKAGMPDDRSGMAYGTGSMPSNHERGIVNEREKEFSGIGSSSRPISSAPRSLTNFEKENRPVEPEANTIPVAAKEEVEEEQSKGSISIAPPSGCQNSDCGAGQEIVSEATIRPSIKDAAAEIKAQLLPSIDISIPTPYHSSLSGTFREKEIQRFGDSPEPQGIDELEKDGIVPDIVGQKATTEPIKARSIERGIAGNEWKIHSKKGSSAQDDPHPAGKTLSPSYRIIEPLRSSKNAIIGNDQAGKYASSKEEFVSEALEDSTKHSIDPETAIRESLLELNGNISRKRRIVAEDDEIFQESASLSSVPRIFVGTEPNAISPPAISSESSRSAKESTGEGELDANSEMPLATHLPRSYHEAKQHPRPIASRELKGASLKSELPQEMEVERHGLSASKKDAIISDSAYSNDLKSDSAQRHFNPSPSIPMPSMDTEDSIRRDEPAKESHMAISQKQTPRPLKAEPSPMLSSQIYVRDDLTCQSKGNIDDHADPAIDIKNSIAFQPSISRGSAESQSFQPWPNGQESERGHHSNEPQIADPSPGIKVTIGRVSVHASQIAQPAREDPQSSLPQKLSLNDYLKMRDEGRI
jgi:hypothetical protein